MGEKIDILRVKKITTDFSPENMHARNNRWKVLNVEERNPTKLEFYIQCILQKLRWNKTFPDKQNLTEFISRPESQEM